MLKVDCDVCHKEIDEPGGLLFSPPDKITGSVWKYHICKGCYQICVSELFVSRLLHEDEACDAKALAAGLDKLCNDAETNDPTLHDSEVNLRLRNAGVDISPGVSVRERDNNVSQESKISIDYGRKIIDAEKDIKEMYLHTQIK